MSGSFFVLGVPDPEPTLRAFTAAYLAIFGKPSRKGIYLRVGLGLVTKVKCYPYRGPTMIRATSSSSFFWIFEMSA